MGRGESPQQGRGDGEEEWSGRCGSGGVASGAETKTRSEAEGGVQSRSKAFSPKVYLGGGVSIGDAGRRGLGEITLS